MLIHWTIRSLIIAKMPTLYSIAIAADDDDDLIAWICLIVISLSCIFKLHFLIRKMSEIENVL